MSYSRRSAEVDITETLSEEMVHNDFTIGTEITDLLGIYHHPARSATTKTIKMRLPVLPFISIRSQILLALRMFPKVLPKPMKTAPGVSSEGRSTLDAGTGIEPETSGL